MVARDSSSGMEAFTEAKAAEERKGFEVDAICVNMIRNQLSRSSLNVDLQDNSVGRRKVWIKEHVLAMVFLREGEHILIVENNTWVKKTFDITHYGGIQNYI